VGDTDTHSHSEVSAKVESSFRIGGENEAAGAAVAAVLAVE
jgi:hypothetical protein